MAYQWAIGGKRLKDTDLPKAGSKIGVGEDEIHAVLDVETAGGGFDTKGRPKMLFEPHIFYRQLEEYPAALSEAAAAGIAYRKWVRNYPKDSYPRLQRAITICLKHNIGADAAFKSASWGLGQIMGFNHELAGYSTAREMALDFRHSEGVQLEAMVEFIKNTGLSEALRKHDWHAFARGYNGAGYAKNGYHTKLARAYAKWSRIKDTPWTPEKAPRDQNPQKTPASARKAPSGGAGNGLAALLRRIFEAFRNSA
jgi:hypothetical protein